MAYNVSLLNDFIKEQNFPILKASVMGAKTASIFTIQSGIKSSAQLNIMDFDVVLQNDSVGASTDGGGNIRFSQRNLKVTPMAIREFLDPKSLNSKYLQSQMKAGSDDNALPFEQEMTDLIVAKLNASLETALWQGNTALASSSLNNFDGYVKLIDAATGVTITTGVTVNGVTATNISGYVDAVYSAIPVAILDAEDTSIYMGRDAYRLYTTALKNANLFHYTADSTDGEIVVPGTTIKIYALNGLNGTNRMFAGRKSNFFVGCDLDSEEDSASSVYIDAIEKVKIKIAFKYGVQVAFPSEIVTFKLA